MNTNHIKVNVGDFQIGGEERRAINEVLDSGKITEGFKVKDFERKLAEYTGTKYAVAVNSGTSALIAGIAALKRKNGDKWKSRKKVITTPITYVATSNAIVLNNLEPVFVDIDPFTFSITPDNIRAHLEEADEPEEYGAIAPVHLMGYPCDMDEINKIAKEYDLDVIEDSAQALGTLYKGRQAGSQSDISIFSFYIAHNVQAGEMGAVVTDDLETWKLIKKIKSNGRMCDCRICTRQEGKCPKLLAYKGKDDFDPRFTHEFVGYNFKTMDFQAALALTQFKKVDWIIKQRQENVRYLNEGLESFSDQIQLPAHSKDISYLAYPMVLKPESKIQRKQLREELEKLGVETRPLFGCIPTQQPAYMHLKEEYADKLPNADYVGHSGFYIGCHQYLTTKELDHVIASFKKIFSSI
ncbi:DegT/DnrJ/EryC1/StrS family aminotransferase [uncultured Methanolobus sp.]|uniref:DegT/DnrJ/EryC1/StrS family aminotransferase n=1 Tax=uncultured Methanolobus sp. TaxID=218300 RepID=UPI002AAC2A91|nr:DegT/DnrJ/EryC1/StrS family aminotransferase [uncultured Methanolobus sp.]